MTTSTSCPSAKSGMFGFGPRGGIKDIGEYKAKLDARLPNPPRVVVKEGVAIKANDEDNKTISSGYAKAEKKRGIYGLSAKGGVQKVREEPYGHIKPHKVMMVNGVAIVDSKKEETKQRVWECHMCTAENNCRRRSCVMCKAPRKRNC